MAEDRAEHTDVVTAAVSSANHQPVVHAVSETQPRGEVQTVLDVAAEVRPPDAGGVDLTGFEIQETAVASFVEGLRIDYIEAQSVIDSQLRRGSPGILPVVKMA